MNGSAGWKSVGAVLLFLSSSGCAHLFQSNECALPDKDGKPKGIVDLLKVGTNYLGATSYDQAFACFDSASRQSPEGYEVNLKIGIAEIGRARSEGNKDSKAALIQSAKKHLGKAFMNRQGHSEALYYLAEAAVLEKSDAVARQFLAMVEATKTKAGPTHALLGFVDQRGEHQAESLRHYRTVPEVGGPEATLKYAFLQLRTNGSFKRPPPLPPPGDARAPLVPYREFRLGLFDFGKSAALGGERYSLMIPALLVSELKKTTRFAIYEGGNLPGDSVLKRANAKDYVDGYLDGTVTSISGEQVCFAVRLTNAQNFEVLFGRSLCVPQSGSQLIEAIERLSKDIYLVIKKIVHGQVLNAEGSLVFINKGSKSGVIRGMVAYITATGELAQDAAAPNVRSLVASYSGLALEKGPDAPVVGELYIVSVDENSSVGRLSSGDFALPGDTVIFK